MPDPIPSCFRGGAGAAPPASTAAGPSVTTSIYETHLGLAALTWSRTVLGLSLRVDLRLPSVSSPTSRGSHASDAASVSSAASADCTDASFRFRLRPWLFWKRRGSKRFQLREQPHHHRAVDFAWDLTRARFPPGGGPEPSAGFFVAIVVDGEMFLVVGDMELGAYRKTKARNPFPTNPSRKDSPGNPILISRREHVVLPSSGRTYTTRARFGGEEREISIDLGGGRGGEKDARMCVGLDGKRIIQVKRLKWKFRGNEKVELEGGGRIQVSWDVHNWLFDREPDPSAPAPAAAAASAEFGHAVFVFRVDREDADEKGGASEYAGKKRRGIIHGGGLWGLHGLGSFGNSDRSNSSIAGGVTAVAGVSKAMGKKKSLRKTSSSSSSSSASSGSSSSVADWASAEETELQGSGGFSLLVYVWKT